MTTRGGPRLSRDEDEVLRRLHYFERCGHELADRVQQRKVELLERDRRDQVRDPREGVLVP